MDLQSFYDAAKKAVERFDAWIIEASPEAFVDHICFKCGSVEEYEQMRSLFEQEGRYVYQSIISNRRIAVIGLQTVIHTKRGKIMILELSDQKPDGSQKSGFDHIEIYPMSGSVRNLVEMLESRGLRFERVVRPHHTTYDLEIGNGFKVRLEEEPLVKKISREEFR